MRALRATRRAAGLCPCGRPLAGRQECDRCIARRLRNSPPAGHMTIGGHAICGRPGVAINTDSSRVGCILCSLQFAPGRRRFSAPQRNHCQCVTGCKSSVGEDQARAWCSHCRGVLVARASHVDALGERMRLHESECCGRVVIARAEIGMAA